MKEAPRHAGHEGYRHEHDDDRQRCRQHRQPDIVRPVAGSQVRGLARGEMLFDVLDFDNGIVDQNADHQCQRQQGHDVQRKAEKIEHGEGR